MGKVYVENIRVYAYHGCLPEETRIGSDYRVDVWVSGDLAVSEVSDKLEDTIDYVSICACVQEEMATPSKLLEHVAKRIMNRIFEISAIIDEVNVKVAKINPPIGGHVAAVAVALCETKK
jgi:dihydroneopterin aldolase